MDTHDVSDNFIDTLSVQKANLAAGMARDGEIPRDRKSVQELVKAHRMLVMQDKMRKLLRKDDESQIHACFIPPSYPPSTESLETLTQIHIRELQLGVHHRGRYLMVGSLTEPRRLTGIQVIVEDQNGDGTLLTLYHQPNEETRPATSVITEGDVFLVKEPFFKVMGDGGYGVRVDHVTDIVPIDDAHSLCPNKWNSSSGLHARTALEWKRNGNIAISKQEYRKAIDW